MSNREKSTDGGSAQDGRRTTRLKKKAAEPVSRVVVGVLALLVTVAILSIVFILVDVVLMLFEHAGIPGWQAAIISVVLLFGCYILGGFVKAGIEI